LTLAESWPGRHLDGRSARPRPVAVRLGPAGLALKPARGRAQHWPYAELRQEQGAYAGDPVRLERGDGPGETLLVEAPGFQEALQRAAPPGLRRRFHDPATRRRRAWLTAWAGVATVALAWAFHAWVLPSLAQAVALRLPLSWEQAAAKPSLDLLLGLGQEKRPVLQGVVQGIVDRLAQAAPTPRRDYPFKVYLVDSGVVNALALPGGSIVVFRGLLEKTRSPEELAGVLAHEMQHVLKRHGIRHIVEDSGTGLLLSAVSGDASGTIFTAQAAATLGRLRYSRQDESEADAEGMKLLRRAGIDVNGMVAMFETLRGLDHEPKAMKYLATHPDMDSRLAVLKALAAPPQPGLKPIGLPKGRSWHSLVAAR
jgi:predicted Zn-dependent protease